MDSIRTARPRTASQIFWVCYVLGYIIYLKTTLQPWPSGYVLGYTHFGGLYTWVQTLLTPKKKKNQKPIGNRTGDLLQSRTSNSANTQREF